MIDLAAGDTSVGSTPTNVKQVYKSEWQGVADFLGNNYVHTRNRKYRSFAMAREWVRAQDLQSETQWREYSKRPGWLPVDIPASVHNVYKMIPTDSARLVLNFATEPY